MKRIFYVLICIVMVLSFALAQVGCSNKADVSVTYDFIISETKKTLEVGQEFTLIASYGDSAIMFKSSDSEVATVTNDGKVTAHKEGTAFITVSSDKTDKQMICEINVKFVDYSVVFTNNEEFFVFIGAYKNLSVITLKDGVEYDGEVTWSVTGDGAKFVQVDGKNAVFVSNKAGTFEVTVSGVDGGQAKLIVNVIANV